MTTTTDTDTATPTKAIAITGALLVIGVIIAVIVALAAGGSDDVADSTTALDSRIPQGAARQVSFAEVTGTALPRFEGGLVDDAVGLDAPEFTASYFDNVETTINPADGNARIIIFLAHWCPHCQAEVTAITEWIDTNGLPADVDIIGISTGVDQGAPNYPPSTWLLRENWPLPVLRDSAQSDLAAGYGLAS